jgi:hypothetical protein
LEHTARGSSGVEHPTQCGDLHVEIAVLDRDPGPHRSEHRVARDELAGMGDQHAQNIERARAECDRREAGTRILAEQAAAPVKAKASEQKNVARGKRAHASASHPRDLRFITIYNFLSGPHSAPAPRTVRSVVRPLRPD